MISIGVFVGPQADTIWDKVRSLILSAMSHAHGEMSLEDVRKRVFDSRAQIWIVHKEGRGVTAVAVTEFSDYDRMSVMRVLGMAGMELHEWFETFNEALHRYAHKHGAKRIEAACRGGLARMLDRYGYKPTYVVLTQEVKTDGQAGRDDTDGGHHRSPGIPNTLHPTHIV